MEPWLLNRKAEGSFFERICQFTLLLALCQVIHCLEYDCSPHPTRLFCSMTNLTQSTQKLMPNMPPAEASKIVKIFIAMDKYEMGVGLTPSDIFTQFPNVQFFELKFTTITTIDPQTFTNGDRLINIDLTFNRITKFPSGMMELRDLSVLKLAGNEIEYIDDFAFSRLNSIKYLYLEANRLTTISRNMFTGLGQLKSLYLFRNQIHTIEDGAFDFPNLEILSIFQNKLKTLSDNIFTGLKSIQIIAMEKNEIETIGNSFTADLKTLNFVGLDYNQIKDVDFCKFALLPKLTFFHMIDTIASSQNVKIISIEKYFKIKYKDLASRRFPIPNVTNGDIECVFQKLSILEL